MDRQMNLAFDQEVESSRRALLYFARQCDWDAFKARAGRLFDYVEQVEAVVREQRFYRLFFAILAALVLAVMIVTGWNPGEDPRWQDFRRNVIFASLAASSFELFFYMNFRRYVEARASVHRQRREAFIRGIMQDFREYAGRQMMNAA